MIAGNALPHAVSPIDNVATLLAHAHAMEADAVDRYQMLAAQMEVHNNPELAAFFAKMAAIEAKHVVRVDAMAEEFELPRLRAWDYQWTDAEGPETTGFARVTYRLTPNQALGLAMENEKRAVAFFTDVARLSNDEAVRAMAEQLAAEERHHVELLIAWTDRYPVRPGDAIEDLDDPVGQE